jgi:CHAT domain-containing protein
MEQAKRVEEISIARTRLLVASLPERQALRAAEERASSIDLLLSLADKGVAGAVELAWDAVVRARAAVLDELAFRQRLSVGEGVDQELAEYATASRRLANLLVHGPPTGDAAVFKESVASARRRREAAEKRLALASAEYRRLDGERDIGLDRVRAALPSGSALVGYVLYRPDPLVAAPTAPGLSIDEEARPEERYAALVAGPESAVRLVHLGAREEVDAAVDRWRRAIADGLSGGDEAAYRHQAADLRRLVWDPVAARLDSRGRVFVVPDGRLHLVSLATLPKGATGYLVEETTFHYLSSERDLAAPVGGPGGSGLLAVGGADYGDASDESAPAEAVASTLRAGEACPAFRRASFEPLEGAASEARSIASRWQAERGAMAGAALLLEGADASEARFKAEAPGRRVLHLATHGFFLGAECPTSASGERGVGGLVGPGDETQTAAAVGEWLGPLQLSGLALAGANRPARAEPDEEDGILTAEEISALELTGVEWAVLSGCDTGLGEIRAREGVFGLRRAFRVAGASTLIMSLWKVHDEVAAEWMESLYEARLTGGADTMTAVTAATRELLANRRRNQAVTHPALWGGFVASGEWR